MQEDESTGSVPTLEVSTWFQVHRDRDEHCCKLAFVTEQFRVSCTGCNEDADFFDRQLIEFAKALIEFKSTPTGSPTFEVENGELDYFESCRVRIAQAREGVARLEFRHRTWPNSCSPIMGRIWVEVEEARTFHVEIPMEDVRGMAYGLLSTVADGKDFSFCLRPAPPPAPEAGEPRKDGAILLED